MTYESCRFLFHRFIQWDKTDKIIADADAHLRMRKKCIDEICDDRFLRFVFPAHNGLQRQKDKSRWITVDK